MSRFVTTGLVLLGLFCFLSPPPADAGGKKKAKQVVAYTASSLKDYLEYALHYNYCYPVKDAFDKRTCKKRWKKFASKMLKWVKRVLIIDDSVDVEIKPYDFKKRRFVIHHTANIVTNSESDVRGRIVIGKGHCDRMTGLAEVTQSIAIRMSGKKAAKHVLRRAAGSRSIQALLRGGVGRVNWCCDAGTRRGARRMKENCKPKLLLYKIVGFLIAEEGTFRYKYPRNVVSRDFDPNVLGGYIPTGSGDFEKATRPGKAKKAAPKRGATKRRGFKLKRGGMF